MVKVALNIFLLFLAGNIFSQEVWNLNRCLQHAVENNLTIKRANLNLQIQDANVTQSKLDFLPGLNADGNGSANYGRSIDPTTYTFSTDRIVTNSFGVSTNLALFNGFRKHLTVQKNQFDYNANRFAVDEAQLNISVAVLRAYLDILLSKEELAIAKYASELSRNQLIKTEKLVEAGRLPEGTLFEIQAQIANDELAVINRSNQLDLANLNLKLLLRLNPETSITLASPANITSQLNVEDIPTLMECVNMAYEQHPSVKISEMYLFSAEKGIKIAQSGYYPRINAFANMNTSYSDARKRFSFFPSGPDSIGYVKGTGEAVLQNQFSSVTEDFPWFDQLEENFSQNIGVSLSIPIFNQWQTKTNVTKARISRDIADLNVQESRDRIRNEVEQAYALTMASIKQYNAATSNLQAMTTSHEYSSKKAEVGLLQPLDYFISSNNLRVAGLNHVKAKYEIVFRKALLGYYIGKPMTIGN